MKQKIYDMIQQKSKQEIEKWVFCFVALLILSLGTIVFAGQVTPKEKIYYQSIVIHQGDTLWDIAKQYKSETETTEHMIDKIMECNQMRSANIKAGHRILIPISIT